MIDLERKVEQVMEDTIRVFFGRTFGPEEIELIRWTRKKYPGLSRAELASTLCEFWGWITPSGIPKKIQCLKVLEELEAENLVTLPIKKARKAYVKKENQQLSEIKKQQEELNGNINDYEPVELKIARTGNSLSRWRAYVGQYHMLGEKQVYGSQLFYFIKSGDKELGCMQFSASAWALESRDRWIGWTTDDRKARLNLIINNSRYLIFPWVHIKNLASKALSLAARQIQEDWLREYCFAPVLLETFVDLEHFKGTSYKAANWIHLGETKGRGRADRYKEYALSKKAIYMYPLQKDFKEVLKGEKPYKAVNPDD